MARSGIAGLPIRARRRESASAQDGVGDLEDRKMGVLAGPAEQVPGLGRGQVVQGHQNPGCGRDPLRAGSR